MAINRSSIASASITEDNFDVCIEILSTRPAIGAYLSTPTTPNKLVGYYDSVFNVVELYLTDNTGRRYLRVG